MRDWEQILKANLRYRWPSNRTRNRYRSLWEAWWQSRYLGQLSSYHRPPRLWYFFWDGNAEDLPCGFARGQTRDAAVMAAFRVPIEQGQRVLNIIMPEGL